MKKINFTNATVTAQASVEIDGVSHGVTPAVIEGGTLPTPDNMNQLQNNVEEAILNPVVESIKSKNLLDENGVIAEGSIGFPVYVEAGKTYTISSNLPIYWFKIADNRDSSEKGAEWLGADGYTEYTFTCTKSYPYVFIGIDKDNPYNLPTNLGAYANYKLQINDGSTAEAYTPYKKYGYNSKESMGSIVVDDIRSKNLFNLHGSYTCNINSPTISGNSIILPSSDGNGGYTKFSQKIEVNGSLTFSCTISDGNGYARPLLIPLDSSGNVITDLTIEGYSYNQFYGGYWKECADGKYSLTLNLSSNVKFLQLGFIHVSAKFTDIQIEEGSTATNCSEYKDFDSIGSWVDIALANTYSFLDLVAYNGLQCKKIGNQVFLRGMLINSVANPVGYYATCGFVPEECRPKKPVYLICNQEGGTCNCTVETDGGIRVYNTKANSWIALDSMRFFVD